MVNNVYPEKREMSYRRTSVEMPDVVIYLKSLDFPPVIKRAAYTVFRIESGNGHSGVCWNFGGMQADDTRWQKKYDKLITGTCVVAENGTNKPRRFICFDSFHGSVFMLADRLKDRGIYIGGYAEKYARLLVTDVHYLVRAYYKEWVTGNPKAEPPEDLKRTFLSIYAQACKVFV